jgi:hypothetical protein
VTDGVTTSIAAEPCYRAGQGSESCDPLSSIHAPTSTAVGNCRRLNFCKSEVQNRLQGHRDTTVKMSFQTVYTLVLFPYYKAFNNWKDALVRGGGDQ